MVLSSMCCCVDDKWENCVVLPQPPGVHFTHFLSQLIQRLTSQKPPWDPHKTTHSLSTAHNTTLLGAVATKCIYTTPYASQPLPHASPISIPYQTEYYIIINNPCCILQRTDEFEIELKIVESFTTFCLQRIVYAMDEMKYECFSLQYEYWTCFMMLTNHAESHREMTYWALQRDDILLLSMLFTVTTNALWRSS